MPFKTKSPHSSERIPHLHILVKNSIMSTSRSFDIQTTDMPYPKVAIIVVPANGDIHGYVSHGARDWPALHEALYSLNLGPQNLHQCHVDASLSSPLPRFTTRPITASPGVHEYRAHYATAPDHMPSLQVPEPLSSQTPQNTPEPERRATVSRTPEAKIETAGELHSCFCGNSSDRCICDRIGKGQVPRDEGDSCVCRDSSKRCTCDGIRIEARRSLRGSKSAVGRRDRPRRQKAQYQRL